VKILHEVKAVWGQQVQIQAQPAVDNLPRQVALEKKYDFNCRLFMDIYKFLQIYIPQVLEDTPQ
jgi:hypothetical protein